MICSFKYKMCYIGIPKCGTNSIMNIITKDFGFYQYQLSNRIGSSGYHDGTIIMNPDWHTFTVVRNPYARLASIWNYSCKEVSFIHFVDQILSKTLASFWYRTQSEWIVYDKTIILRLENIDNDFNTKLQPYLKFSNHIKVGRHNKAKAYKSPYIGLSQKYIDDIYNHYKQDFIQFNYTREII